MRADCSFLLIPKVLALVAFLLAVLPAFLCHNNDNPGFLTKQVGNVYKWETRWATDKDTCHIANKALGKNDHLILVLTKCSIRKSFTPSSFTEIGLCAWLLLVLTITKYSNYVNLVCMSGHLNHQWIYELYVHAQVSSSSPSCHPVSVPAGNATIISVTNDSIICIPFVILNQNSNNFYDPMYSHSLFYNTQWHAAILLLLN